jgi:hypothetical protein
MNKDGSLLAIGDPMNIYDETNSQTTGRVILLEAVVVHVDDVEYEGDEARLSYRIIQVLQAPDADYNGFGTALALSSSSLPTTNTSSTLVVGIPRERGIVSNFSLESTVQVYVQQTTAAAAANVNNQAQENDLNWELDDKFAAIQSSNAETGSWVAVSDDGSRILYSVPRYGTTTGAAVPQEEEDDQVYHTTTGAVLLWNNGQQEAFLMGECNDQDEGFGQTISMSSAVDGTLPVVVIYTCGMLDQ